MAGDEGSGQIAKPYPEESLTLDRRIAALRMKDILGIETEPVAVLLLGTHDDLAGWAFTEVSGHRSCQLLMPALRGESVVLNAGEAARNRTEP